MALGLFHRPEVDVVLSGVNLGTNMGNGMWHSGTLAAAEQAVLLGRRGIALTHAGHRDETPSWTASSRTSTGCCACSCRART